MKLAIQYAKRLQWAGTSLIEYGMLLALIAILAMLVVKNISVQTTSTYDNIQSQMTSQGVGSVSPQTPGSTTGSASGSSSGQGGNSGNNGNHYGQNRN